MLIAMISLQVGILNLFPLAPLDGGHLAIIAAEGVVRRDFSLDVKTWIMNAGAIVLLLPDRARALLRPQQDRACCRSTCRSRRARQRGFRTRKYW